ncbi:MAG TPA: sensor histidine kinase [Micromonosporaceae bacterium]
MSIDRDSGTCPGGRATADAERWDGSPWQRGRPPWVLPLVLALVQVFISRVAANGQPTARHLDPIGYALLVAGPLALLVGRRYPLATLAVTLAATDAYYLLGYPYGPAFLALVVAVFRAVQGGRQVGAWALVGGGYLGYLLVGWTLPVPRPPTVGHAVAVAVWALVVLALAEAARVRAQHVREVARIRAEQARTRAEQQRRQASEERLRIARELHDVLGHHLSLINVQAGVGLHLMDDQPEQARTALLAIKQASSEALREVRSVLAALRPRDESAPLSPAASLTNLGALVDEAALPVQVTIEGRVRPVPAEVDRAAYRIVQEALTNVRRHAGPEAPATVIVDYRDAALWVRVENDGPLGPTPPDGDGSGAGIVGMRERAEALGGTLTAGPRPGGGFLVEARLPVGEEER